MRKFWSFVLLLVLTSFVLIAAENRTSATDNINFKDLETECRRSNAEANVVLQNDNSLRFSGSFPESTTHAELDYFYRQTEDRILLNVRSTPERVPEDFIGSCLGSVVYSAETEPLEPGRYTVEVRHKGNEVRKFVLRVN